MDNYIVKRLMSNRIAGRLHEKAEFAPRNYYKKVERILNNQLGSYETGVDVEYVYIISETPETITIKVQYSVDVQIPIVDPETKEVYTETETEYRTRTMTLDYDELER